jgi:hypothetical protein
MLEKKDKIIINYFGGSYGTFVELFLTGEIMHNAINSEKKHFHYIQLNFKRNFQGTHENENALDKLNLKITFEKEHIDLICRNKWYKLEDDIGLLKKSSSLMFKDYELEIDQNSKEIITISFYKNALLHGLTEWNKIQNKNTIELPFVYFLSDQTNWLKNWKILFEKLEIDVTTEYILEAHNIFNKTQSSLFQSHNFYKGLTWKERDVIAKGNLLGELYFQKYSKKTIPIDVVKYRNTNHMLSEWINILNNTNSIDKIR